MAVFQNLLSILEGLTMDAQQVSQEKVEELAKLMLDANRIFVAGAGRSGFVARAFSNRLMHLGLDVHFVGEPTCPSIRKGDLLLIGSGSGTTKGMVLNTETALKEGAKVATVTTNKFGTIANMADVAILVPGSAARSNTVSQVKAPTIQPIGSSFEQLTWLIYDGIVVDLKKALNQSQEQMNYRHANME